MAKNQQVVPANKKEDLESQLSEKEPKKKKGKQKEKGSGKIGEITKV